jgi:hypothetical protein
MFFGEEIAVFPSGLDTHFFVELFLFCGDRSVDKKTGMSGKSFGLAGRSAK